MINYTWTDEDIKLAEKFIEIRRRGYYCDSKQLTDLYNRVLHKNVNVTNCGSCLSQRCRELEGALNHYKERMANEAISSPSDSVEEVKVDNVKEEENKELTEAEIMKERMAKVRAARKNQK